MTKNKKDPQGPRLNVRLPRVLHRKLKVYASLRDLAIPHVITKALSDHLKDFQVPDDK